MNNSKIIINIALSHLKPCLVRLDLHHISGWCVKGPSVPSSYHLKQYRMII